MISVFLIFVLCIHHKLILVFESDVIFGHVYFYKLEIKYSSYVVSSKPNIFMPENRSTKRILFIEESRQRVIVFIPKNTVIIIVIRYINIVEMVCLKKPLIL